MSEAILNAPSANLQSDINLQHQCPLFAVIPAEIRSLIYTYALTDYEDATHKYYDSKTYWYRPGYKARRRTATELLRTCKRIFQETWFLPFALAEHCFYLTHDARAPRNPVTVGQMRQYLKTLRDFARNQDGMDIPQIQSIRVFAQLWALETPKRLQTVLNLEGFQPKIVTITIRYTDFWFWEENQPLHIDARWVKAVKFPESVIMIKLDLEMIDRRKREVDFIADMAAEKWFFQRKDGTVLKASKEDISTSRWTGSSTWGEERWIRDESRTNEIDYYVKTVTWKPTFDVDPFPEGYCCPNLDIPAGFTQEPVPHLQGIARVPVSMFQAAGVSIDAPAEQVVDAWTAFAARQHSERRNRGRRRHR